SQTSRYYSDKMVNRKKNTQKIRISLVFSFLMIMLSIVIVRAFQLQIIDKSEYVNLAKEQFRRTITLSSERGIIYDRNGNELAISTYVDSIYVNPKRIKNKKKFTQNLSKILNIKQSELDQKCNPKKSFVWVKRRVTSKESEALRKLNSHAIGFLRESKRFYPNSEIGAHVIGFAGIDSIGLEGIERKYDTYLRYPGSKVIVGTDGLGRPIHLNGISKTDTAKYLNLVLTIDKNIQFMLQEELSNIVRKSSAKGAVGIVMQPYTGEILAMASLPEYDPNTFWRYDWNFFKNKAVSDIYEPGSIMKIFLLAAALEKGIISENDTFFCENGKYKVDRWTIHDVHKYETLTLPEVIKYSSNIGAVKIGELLGRKSLYTYLKRFGFGSPTGIDLSGEAKGIMAKPASWSNSRLATISFGQGIGTTPLQLINGFNAIANGGYIMKPHLVKKMIDKNGTVIRENVPTVEGRAVRGDITERVLTILEGVVEEGGTGEKARIEHFSIAGKTSTAQKLDGSRRGYSKNKYLVSFIGCIPAKNPKVSILVMVDEPNGIAYGGTIAAPIFKTVGEKVLNYLCVFPENVPKDTYATLREHNGSNIEDMINIEKVCYKKGLLRTPDFTTMTIRAVIRHATERGIAIRLRGNGIAFSQSPLPGRYMKSSDTITVNFKPGS
ncbi:MAG: penicillin-binding transpeptidase domain-containing protein, partial [Thermodesulfobacteriota bacterium]|nr:penicillin-binding transpeptidase domain-containing protein [Thermodesulfobacteriota bacterium]